MTARCATASASGAATGGAFIGGLVGSNDGTVQNSYSTAAVSGFSSVGGLVASNNGSVTNSFWDDADQRTTDERCRHRVDHAPARQAALDPDQLVTPFSTVTNLGDTNGTIWAGGANGLYPFLKSFYPNGVQAVSGLAYKDAGVTLAASGPNGAVPVTVLAGGQTRGTAFTGANGYYAMWRCRPARSVQQRGRPRLHQQAGSGGDRRQARRHRPRASRPRAVPSRRCP